MSVNTLSVKAKIQQRSNKIATIRDVRFQANRYYHQEVIRMLRFYIPEDSTVLEIGCGTGDMLNALRPRLGIGIDIGEKMVALARKKYPHLLFSCMDAEMPGIRGSFEYVVLVDTIGFLDDIQKTIGRLRSIVTPQTRLIIVFHNFLWQPVLQFAEMMRTKIAWKVRLNWIDTGDMVNLLRLEGFDSVVTAKSILLPVEVPAIASVVNSYIASIPGLHRCCLSNVIVARRCPSVLRDASVSVIIPARNEAGNIEAAVERIPQMGSHTEILFVEGHSTDATINELERVVHKYQAEKDVKFCIQKGTGKADAVREGFNRATGDILMILDADLTVAPEDLPKFHEAIVSGQGEFINGSRLVYPLDKGSMQLLNIFGNKFFSLAFSWILGQRIKDTLCGTKVLLRENWKKIERNRAYFGDFDPFGDFDLIFGAAKLGLKIVEVPVRYHARHYGVTNISRFSHGWLLFKMLAIALRKIKFAR
ncbi:MAG: glycosyltransferase [Chitinispirillaceae bacterium]|nr:glycosyltransferase [Chitinispirillaceae bacterium]